MKKMVTLEARWMNGKVEFQGLLYDTVEDVAREARLHDLANDDTDAELLVWSGPDLADVVTVRIKPRGCEAPSMCAGGLVNQPTEKS
jgi:hypothetical protein